MAANGEIFLTTPYSTVHSFYRRARISGLWDKILQHLVKVTRRRAGRNQTDTLGCLLAVKVHRANLHDTKAGIFPAIKAYRLYPTIQAICADAGYRKTFVANVETVLNLRVDISP